MLNYLDIKNILLKLSIVILKEFPLSMETMATKNLFIFKKYLTEQPVTILLN